MLTIRRRYHSEQHKYFADLYERYGCIPENEQKAMDLRMEFFRKFILERKPTQYETATEKDWMYIARREYYWDVTLRSIGDGIALGLLASTFMMFMKKKFVIFPLPVVGTLFGVYRNHDSFCFHNKKFFDMCNLGEQYEIGRERNKVLKQCNALLDREDF